MHPSLLFLNKCFFYPMVHGIVHNYKDSSNNICFILQDYSPLHIVYPAIFEIERSKLYVCLNKKITFQNFNHLQRISKIPNKLQNWTDLYFIKSTKWLILFSKKNVWINYWSQVFCLTGSKIVFLYISNFRGEMQVSTWFG